MARRDMRDALAFDARYELCQPLSDAMFTSHYAHLMLCLMRYGMASGFFLLPSDYLQRRAHVKICRFAVAKDELIFITRHAALSLLSPY